MNDLQATFTTILWASLKTHVVMREYMAYNFHDHSGIASVITVFVITTAPEGQDKVTRKELEVVEKKSVAATRSISTLEGRVAAIDARLKAQEKK